MFRNNVVAAFSLLTIFLSSTANAEFYFYPNISMTQSTYKTTLTYDVLDESGFFSESKEQKYETEKHRDWLYGATVGLDNIFVSYNTNTSPEADVKDSKTGDIKREDWSLVVGVISHKGSWFAGYQTEKTNINNGSLEISQPGYVLGLSGENNIGKNGASFAYTTAASLLEPELVFGSKSADNSSIDGSGFAFSIRLELGVNVIKYLRASVFGNVRYYMVSWDDEVYQESETMSTVVGVKLASRF